MKNICVITGASSGIGREFFDQLVKRSDYKFDEFWVIARGADKLAELRAATEIPVRAVSLDLSKEESYDEYKRILEEEKPRIRLFVNCSGFGKFESSANIGVATSLNMIDLNVKATVALDLISLEYMEKGDGIINVASVAAYQPIPFINVYGATKSFVLNFTRALSVEVKGRGIQVMAVCPFWTKTKFFDRAVKEEKDPVVKKYVVMYKPEDIAKRALDDYKKGKKVSMYGVISKLQVLAVKLMPASVTMKIWVSQQKLKNRQG